MDISIRKHKLRKELLKRRSSIPEEEYLRKSAIICRQLAEMPEFKNAETVHCYVSMNERREPDTLELINSLLVKMRQVVVPVMNIENGTLKHVEFINFNQLKTNSWNVIEPTGSIEIPVGELDVVIVPMVGGDMNKNRIGYGKGFYDRFLSQVSCPKIGLLFETCLVDELPVEPFDVALDMLISEKRII